MEILPESGRLQETGGLVRLRVTIDTGGEGLNLRCYDMVIKKNRLPTRITWVIIDTGGEGLNLRYYDGH